MPKPVSAKEHYQERTDRRKEAIDDMVESNAKKPFGENNPDGKITQYKPSAPPLPKE